jgi:hypothetical protein
LSRNVGTWRSRFGSRTCDTVAFREVWILEVDLGEADEGCGLSGVALVISGEPAATADPNSGALDDPAIRERRSGGGGSGGRSEAARSRCGQRRLRPCVLGADLADDALNEGEAPSRLAQECLRAVAILHAGRVDVDGEQQWNGPSLSSTMIAW